MPTSLSYSELLQHLYQAGFTRIERDDRLLDIFPTQDREKGIELWERWDVSVVYVLRTRVPFAEKKLQLFRFPRQQFERLLFDNQVQDLDGYRALAEGKYVLDLI